MEIKKQIAVSKQSFMAKKNILTSKHTSIEMTRFLVKLFGVHSKWKLDFEKMKNCLSQAISTCYFGGYGGRCQECNELKEKQI